MPIKWFKVFSDLAEGLHQMSFEKGFYQFKNLKI